MTNRAVCYTTDKGYLFPSFVSATQARRALSPDVADVIIFALGVDAQILAKFVPACEREGIRLVPVSTAAIDGASPYYARFFLADLLPPEIETFLYVDSDTQISGSLDPLLQYDLPSTSFLAAIDPMVFALGSNNKIGIKVARHFASLGLSSEQAENYFNSGVLMSSRSLWQDVGRDAWALARARACDTTFPDQDMLNLAALSRNLPLSLGWNFPIYMKNLGVAHRIQPRITHYMSNPKPWSGVFRPWTKIEYDVYGATLRTYPELAPYRLRMRPASQFRYYLQQWYKRSVETINRDTGGHRTAILDYERRAVLNSGSAELL